MFTDTIGANILAAREKRAGLRQQWAAAGKSSLSLTLNLPGYPKSTPLFTAFFAQVLSELKRFLRAHRIWLEMEQEACLRDEAGDFYLAPLHEGQPLIDIKARCEAFEERHPVGRLIDVDLVDQAGQPISSHKLKRCFLCEQPALVCMREQTHTYHDLRAQMAARVEAYLAQTRQEQVCRQLAALAVKACLYELAVSPKPGLVDRFDPGAHQDMDYFTFLDSTDALSGYFEAFARAGYTFPAAEFSGALPLIREIGLHTEAAMFEATHGVNTQKGLIFLLGLALFATSNLIARNGRFEIPGCRTIIAGICRNLVQNELAATAAQAEPTHGARCFQRYGAGSGGARQEAEAGFPSVFELGLPELKTQLETGNSATQKLKNSKTHLLNQALTRTLLRLMTVVDDTNIIYRKDVATLMTVKHMAQRVLAAEDQPARTTRYAALRDYCRCEGISPGGSADLLAVTVFFYFVEAGFSTLPALSMKIESD